MKICPNCGSQVTDSAAFCSYCGTNVAATDSFSQDSAAGQSQFQTAQQDQSQFQTAQPDQSQFQTQYQFQPQVQDQPVPQVKGFDPSTYTAGAATPYYTYHDNMAASYQRDSGIVTAIKIFMVLGCVNALFLGFFPLIWRIPMTIHAFKKLDNNEAMSTGFKVCSLIFTNLIAGILMFIIKDEDMPYQR